MTKSLVIALAAAVLLVAPAAAVSDPVAESTVVEVPAPVDSTNHEAILSTWLDRFFNNVDPRKLTEAKKLIPAVIEAALNENLDPLLVAVVVSCESSWKTDAAGGIGEVGLMQVHGEAARGFDVKTVSGNLAAGTRWLATLIQRYGSVERGLRAYIGGGPRAKKAAAWRMKVYRAELRRQGLTEAPARSEEVVLAAVAPLPVD